MSIIAAMVLAAAAMLFMAYPLFRRPEEALAAADEVGSGDPVMEELVSRRDSTYRAIRELDFDHSIGNLSDQDYEEVRDRLKVQAFGILKEIDQARGRQAVAEAEREAQIEEAVRRARPRARGRARSSGAVAAAGACPSCGQHVTLKDRFCSQCGTTLAPACPACGESYSESQRFCTNCGASLKGGRGA